MDFRNFYLLTENKLQLKTAPGLEQYLPVAKKALTTYLKRYGTDLELNSSSARYVYTLTKFNAGYHAYDTLSFEYAPIEKNRGRDEIIGPDDYRYGIYKDDKTGRKIYKTPKDAIAEIPVDGTLAYRGMSWEEWKLIEKSGVIQSAGSHNFNNQAGLTFYGTRPDTGENYASGFAPVAFKPTPTRPGVVIAVPRNLLKNHKENPNIPTDELAHEGPLPSNKIVNVWMIVITKSKPGRFDLLVYKDGKVREGGGSHIGIGYAIRKMK
jgi:hypothetical protein